MAYDPNFVIGADNELLWKIPEDMKNFKDKTTGNICIMGRKTWESIPEKWRPLSDRLNIVVTSNSAMKVPEGVLLAKSVTEAVMRSRTSPKWQNKEIFIIGGERVYQEGIELADRIYATEIHKSMNTTGKSNVRYFPTINSDEWTKGTPVPGIGANIPYSFVTYIRERFVSSR